MQNSFWGGSINERGETGRQTMLRVRLCLIACLSYAVSVVVAPATWPLALSPCCPFFSFAPCHLATAGKQILFTIHARLQYLMAKFVVAVAKRDNVAERHVATAVWHSVWHSLCCHHHILLAVAVAVVVVAVFSLWQLTAPFQSPFLLSPSCRTPFWLLLTVSLGIARCSLLLLLFLLLLAAAGTVLTVIICCP